MFGIIIYCNFRSFQVLFLGPAPNSMILFTKIVSKKGKLMKARNVSEPEEIRARHQPELKYLSISTVALKTWINTTLFYVLPRGNVVIFILC